MTEYDNTNRGAVWPNDRMREGKKDPEFTGTLNVEGVEYWLKGWKKRPDAKPGTPSLSISINRKDENKAPNPQKDSIAPDGPEDPFDDDIPF